MNSNIIINGKKIIIPEAPYNQINANAILFSGHIHHLLDMHSMTGISNINIEQQYQEAALKQLEQAESFLFLGIDAIGEIISSADADRLEDRTLGNVGYLLSTTTHLLQEIQLTKTSLIHSLEKQEEAS